MGSAEFGDAQRRLVERGPERFLEEISAKRFADIDEWQTEMQLKPMRIGSIQLYSDGLPEPERRLTGVEMIALGRRRRSRRASRAPATRGSR